MSTYNELIKNFEKIRTYMREFYVYGFKSREDYNNKSARSYDDERRRLESWLGDHMSFTRTQDGKNVFISIDSRTIGHNPLYNAWKAKSFTDGDITLHFIIFDILCDPSVRCTLSELIAQIDGKYLSEFDDPMVFDESTVRKKLKEYCEAGIVVCEKVGRCVCYRRAESVDISEYGDMLHFFSEVAPCGVIGSFILDKTDLVSGPFTFKHHYITSAIDSGVTAFLFAAMREGRAVTVTNMSRRKDTPRRHRLIPLRILISAQNGRQHLLAYTPEHNSFMAYRVDYLSNVKLEEPDPRFDELRRELDRMQKNMWGVRVRDSRRLEHVDFTVRAGDNEEYIVNRLCRERRVGTVEKIDDNTYRFSADVYDSGEMIPWIRTFICRIININFSNSVIEKQFWHDIETMYEMYGVGREGDK